ncbi:TetR/AcrR family transcriptional regulator [Geosporobacter ferrireducens]|uniref:TetR/AcrR family transcriptional regulator n=1 Tax=Geosporobacter ferrireducens TaxID=1424294 RepID=UPI00139BBB0F|nr:TetR/AcrR family transcriptional regulator [Geosporobacter ferrireducens]MTI53636.1 TetR/AcrR family transcriptional regulator [Geosporobacter ferrireducens]
MKSTRERIVSISFNLFMQKSYKEVTIKEIVQKAGVSQGAFFHYFKNKEELFQEIVEDFLSSIIGAFNSMGKDSLHQFYRDYADFFSRSFFIEDDGEEGCALSLNFFALCSEALKRFPSFRGKLLKAHQIELNIWEDMIRLAKINGEIESSMKDKEIANIFIHISDGVGLRSIFRESSNENVRDILLTLWDSLYEDLKK